VQSEIAAGIQIAITPGAQARLARARPVDPEAHQACLMGRWHFDRYSFQGFPKARECFELAIAKDPNYAPAYVWLAMAYGAAAYWGHMAPSQAYPKLQAGLRKAAELDDMLAEVQMGLACCSCFYDWDWPAAERYFQKALALNPNLIEARHSYSFLLATLGRLNEAIVEARRAVELDPLNLVGLAICGAHAFDARRWDEAIAQFRVPLEMDASFFPARQGLWRAYRHKNLYAQAYTEAKQAFLCLQDHEVAKAMEQGWQASGYRGAMRLAAETLAARSRQIHVRPTTVALLYAEAENQDQALDWLDQAYAGRDAWLAHLRSPDWDGLRAEPRFQALLQRLKYPPP
jgi:tetratricopeptide (TPR) repeat protein